MELEFIQLENKPTYCVNCEHHVVYGFYNDKHHCKAHVTTPGYVDPVTAVEHSPQYKLCKEVNKDANCKDFVEKQQVKPQVNKRWWWS